MSEARPRAGSVSGALQHLGWPLLAARVGELLCTPMAAARLDEELDGPLLTAEAFAGSVLGRTADVPAVLLRLAEQDGLAALLAMERSLAQTEAGAGLTSLAGALAATSDLRAVAGRAQVGLTLAAEELMAVLQQLRAAAACADLLAAARAERGYAGDAGVAAVAVRIDGLRLHRELAAALGRSIGFEGPDGAACVIDGASPALARARARVRELRAALMKAAGRLIKQPGVAEALQDSFYTEREGRVVLPVRADAFSKRGLVGGIIHDSSATGQTLYVEPQGLIEENNALREAQLAAAAEERRVLEQLSRQVHAAAGSLIANQEGLVAVDGVLARLRLGEAYAGVAPRFAGEEAAEFVLPQARHPLMLLAGVEVVANDIKLARGAALVISGPNAGGKTVALKTLGMCALMAQAGLRLPTRTPATLPPVRTIVTDVGDDQSIAANLSTFSAHMRHVTDALAAAAEDGAGTLVLLDEVAVGTEPEQGAALAESILLALTERGATVVTTTHYERLKLLAMRFPGRFENASVGFDLERLRPTFRLLLGVPGPSSALTVARRLGLPEEVLAHAASLLDDERLQVDALLQQVVAERDALVATRAELERERAATQRRMQEVTRREGELLKQAKSRKQKAYDSAAAELRALSGELAEQRKALRKASKAEDVAAAGEQLAGARAQLADKREPAAPVPGRPPPTIAAGDRVAVPGLGGEGEVVSVKGEKVVVQIGTVRTTVALADVRATKEPSRPRVKASAAAPVKTWAAATASRHFGEDALAIEAGVDNSVDVRGQRAEEAIRMVDRLMDEAIRRDLDVVVVIHGHGSGALKKAVREHLAGLTFVQRQRPGLAAEGGEGVTVVWIAG